MIALPRQNKSINEALSTLALELAVDGDVITVTNALGQNVTTRELTDYRVVFAPGHMNIVTLPQRKFPMKGALAEFLWYMTGNSSVEPVSKYLPNWKNFANNGVVNSNYGCYWKRSIPWIIEELKRDPMSRRAVLNIFQNDMAPFGKDTPCTLSLQFMIRKNQLNLMVRMRSNDVWYGLCIDQFCNSLLHQLVLHSLQVKYHELQLGWYSHSTGSMHVYEDVVSVKTLTDLYSEYQGTFDQGKRFELPENCRFENFWDSIEIEQPFAGTDMLEHFKHYMK